MSVGAGVNERLAALTAAGTSVWLDQIRRTMITSGELERLVREDSLRGVTSNPAIFEKAILGSTDYDEQIAELAGKGLTAREIYDEVAVKDVQLACDVLRSVWDEAGHADGFVSLEVEPGLAHDTDGTLAQAKEYWSRVDRPNLLIKIPGTEEGVPAIEEAIAAGINVNVTLLFSVESYTAIAEAFIRGMERRHEAGESLDVHSVASFFVSRVDTEVDKRLAEMGREDLFGIAAVANARAAYVRYKELFEGERFAALREAGAPVQRPLWASTGVKDPRYSETKYVEELVAPYTVNTMPMNTLVACAEGLEVEGATGDRDPGEELARLGEAGIDMGDVTKKLLKDGIDKFVEPFDKLIGGVELAREGVVTGRPKTIDSSIPDDLEPPIIERVERAEKEEVAKRIWRKDESLWGGPGVPEIGNRLGWLTISDKMLEHASELEEFAAQVKSEGFEHALLLGMGGSSLGPEVIRQSFGEVPGGLRLHVLDSTDPGFLLDTAAGDRRREDDLHRVVEVRRHARDALAHALLLRARRAEREPVRGRHRPGQPARRAGERARLPARVRGGPRHRRPLLGALALRHGAGGPRGREHRGDAAERPGGRAELPEPRLERQLRPLARRRDRPARAARARQGDVRRVRADRQLRALGRAADRGVDRQGGQGHPARGGRADRRAGRLRRGPGLRIPAQ